MTTRQTTIDVVVRQLADRAVASVLFDPLLAAVAEEPEEAIERLRTMLLELAEEQPMRLMRRDRQGPPSCRSIEFDVEDMTDRRFQSARLRTEAVVQAGDSRSKVEVPALSLQFQIEDLDELVAACREHFRQQLPLGFRFPVLSRLLSHPERQVRVESFEMEVDTSIGGESKAQEKMQYPTLSTSGEPLHELLDSKDAPGAFHRDDVVESLLNCLADERDRSALLVGYGGVGKSSILYEATRRIIADEVPERLRDTPVWRVSGGRLTAGARFFGEWQKQVVDLVDELESSGGILFVENLVELLTATGSEGESDGVAGLLLPQIESGSLSLVTELRTEQLGLVEERHPNFLQALRRIRVEPMSPAETDAVLERVSFRLGRQHGVRLAEETRQKIIALVERFQGDRELPGPAVELAERMARTHRGEGVETRESVRPLLQPEHAVDAMASKTGLPEHLLDPNTRFDPEEIRAHFDSQIFDQPRATSAMADLVTILRAGLNPPDRPMGSYLFIGPTGVGKTQTALTLAAYLFGSEDRLLRFDMSEYQDRWSAARLVGRRRGEEGQLVRRIREQPFRVILLDEIEKAHESVFDLLLQVLGEGRLTDGLGQTVSMTNTVVVMTSNLGAGGPSQVGFDAPGSDEGASARRHYVSEVERYFRPEFVGRIDRIVTFGSLGGDTARRLVQKTLDEALAREGLARRNIDVEIADDVVDFLAEAGFDDRYGARPLRQTVESEITARLADFLSKNAELTDTTIEIEMSGDEPRVRG